jgi:diphthamide biosynthesis protein 3
VQAAYMLDESIALSCVQDELADGEEVAHCPSCTLMITVIYNPADFARPPASPPGAPTAAPVPVAT